MATVIHTWEEFEEWAEKHPETEVATLTVNSERLSERAYLKAKNRVSGPSRSLYKMKHVSIIISHHMFCGQVSII